eukprot:CAMPEP_0119146660 /NCGR_PEP_ID=MMETSP1310-20130426/39225_1 /TAXON_ID=464262 /ORGANISM="Genus nov. species nov., Strain RCC2339" /LENGTH=307 /DNA_ID=CAMNT_0007138571 /DNA_START=67 /DNA_END=986 /DNA_ORIENTATION=-
MAVDALRAMVERRGSLYFTKVSTEEVVMGRVAAWIGRNRDGGLPARMPAFQKTVQTFCSRSVVDLEALVLALLRLQAEGLVTVGGDQAVTYHRESEGDGDDETGGVIFRTGAGLGPGDRAVAWVRHPHNSPRTFPRLVVCLAHVTQRRETVRADELVEKALRQALITVKEPRAHLSASDGYLNSNYGSSEREGRISYDMKGWAEVLEKSQSGCVPDKSGFHAQCALLRSEVEKLEFEANPSGAPVNGCEVEEIPVLSIGGVSDWAVDTGPSGSWAAATEEAWESGDDGAFAKSEATLRHSSGQRGGR